MRPPPREEGRIIMGKDNMITIQAYSDRACKVAVQRSFMLSACTDITVINSA